MSGTWRFGGGSDRHAVPVEMRFIDLFMAALGALIFMAMLLSFLLKYIPDGPHLEVPGEEHQEVIRPPSGPLEIVTHTLPTAHVDEPYEMAFAYRGGTGPVAWEIVAGAEELPPGVEFDAERGVLSGAPDERATGRFVLLIRDAEGTNDQQAFEMTVEAARTGSRWLERLLAIVVIGAVLLLWLGSLAHSGHLKERLAYLKEAWSRGQRQVMLKTGPDTHEIIDLPGGLETYRQQLASSQRFSKVMLLVLVLLVAWFAWRLWLS